MEGERSYFFNFEKLAYIRNAEHRPPCILCSLRDQDPEVESLGLEEGRFWLSTLNLYPFNPGQLILFPKRHVLDCAELTQDEVLELHAMTVRSCTMLRDTHRARGFNIGYNMGHDAGASIAHLHQHIIPRYPREIGMAELIAGQRVLVESPAETRKRLLDWIDSHPGDQAGSSSSRAR